MGSLETSQADIRKSYKGLMRIIRQQRIFMDFKDFGHLCMKSFICGINDCLPHGSQLE